MKSLGRYILQLQLIHLFNSHPTDSPCWPSHVWGVCESDKGRGKKRNENEVCEYYYEYVPQGGCHCFSQGYISVAVVNPHGLTLYVDAAQGITYCTLAICAVSNSITKWAKATEHYEGLLNGRMISLCSLSFHHTVCCAHMFFLLTHDLAQTQIKQTE